MQRKTWKTIFNRDNIPESDLPFVRKNASILFTKQRAIDPVSDDIVSYWSNVNTKVSHAAKIEELDFPAAKNELIKTYHENPEKLAFVNDLLQKFDTGLTGINIIESEDINPNGSRDIKAKAMVKTTEGEFEMPYLSEGTMKIIDNAHVIYHVLSTGSVLVFDELDASFHPEVVDAILDLFFSDKSNPLNAQLIFTTLNPRILRKLHRYQIQLVEKDSN